MSNLKRIIRGAGILLIGLGVMQSVGASPILFCNDGPGIDLVNDGCVSGQTNGPNGYSGGGDGIYNNAGGGDSEDAVEAAIFGATGSIVDIMLYGKSDEDASLFTITGIDSNDGTWDVLDDMIGIAYITVKAATSFTLYDVQGANRGVWTTEGILSNGGSQPGMSHLSFWTINEPVQVPEPASLGLLAAGIASMIFIRRRNRQ